MGYATVIVDRLIEAKRRGDHFSTAWNRAIAENPPPFTWAPRTIVRPQGRGFSRETPLEFLRRQCRDSWDGTGEAFDFELADLARELVEARDESGPAKKARRKGRGAVREAA